MIRRECDSDWLLISQIDHARLAESLAVAWGNAKVPRLPERANLIPAVRDHDEGWLDWEQAPTVDETIGRPLNFTEMPMAVSTRIWEKSIAICHSGRQSSVPVLQEFASFLQGRGLRMTHERTIVAEEIFSTHDAFDAELMWHRLPTRDDATKISRSTAFRTIALMLEAGLIERMSLGGAADGYRQTRKIDQGSVWGGLWVSRHFTALAESAIESRKDELTEFTAASEFRNRQLETQRRYREELGDSEWRHDIEDDGFRWLQFFDRLSLLLCMGRVSKTEELTLPEGSSLHMTPLNEVEFAMSPYPFDQDPCTVSVTARRVRADRYTTQEFRDVLRKSSTDRLEWRLVRW
ncbi:DUF3891 family protein [Thalassoroseus pseudoceratinae]|uniref:DUF3891 family protein n=1 Tax=Thalassoroseus pseudoceratinae TaxID=2713176 RepID=UPI0014239A0E|nr:DUF3891 family protein [Thalassoroseus pseudoceratinae]